MTTTGWIIWFACLGLGAVSIFLIGKSIERAMKRDDEARERAAEEER